MDKKGNSIQETVLVTGAMGFVASELIPLLLKENYKIIGTTRRKDSINNFWKGKIEERVWDYRDETQTERILENVSIVIHLQGENVGEGRWTDLRKKEIHDSRILSTKNLINKFPKSVHTFISASAISVYPSSRTEHFDEYSKTSTPTDGFLESVCLQWEEEAKLSKQKVEREVRLRIGLVLGEKGLIAKLKPVFLFGLGASIADGNQGCPWIHIHDLARAILFTLQNKNLEGPVNLVGPNPISFSELANSFGKSLNRPVFLNIPGWFLKLALGEASALPLGSYYIHPKKLKDSGFQFNFEKIENAFMDIFHERS
ncbi:MAG: TIGR01777 family oxidoreductase [Leptospiraceae bacterium]|nr:TIGR01777 family oxidoreductase [Leptospiraceae bacterium]